MLSAVAALVLGLPIAPTTDPTKPNIVYILADDLGYGELGAYGQKLIKTPNIDSLAAEGMRFTQAYSGSTVCAPSRSTFLTGKHTGHTYVRDNWEMCAVGNPRLLAHHLTPVLMMDIHGGMPDDAQFMGFYKV